MKRFLVLFVLCIALTAVLWVSMRPAPLTPQEVFALKAARNAKQMILVGGLGGSKALLTLYAKENGQWKEILTTQAYIGKNGLGKTREGDGKTPVGLFYFTKAFGIAPDPGSHLPYTQVDDTHYWDGDSSSSRYNHFVSTRTYDSFDKNKSEHIVEFVKPYQHCLNISYNEEGTEDLGSAIFLHCYSGKSFTVGGVAVPEDVMRHLLTLIRPDCTILIDTLSGLTSY